MPTIEDIRAREFKNMTRKQCEELKTIFEENYAFCFIVEKGVGDPSRTRNAAILRRKILKEVETASIVECDLCTFSTKSGIAREQYLIIDKDGTSETAKHIGDMIADSETVSSMIVFQKEMRAGMKECFRIVFDEAHCAVVKKANLLVDGERLVLTIRHQTQKDHQEKKADSNKSTCE